MRLWMSGRVEGGGYVFECGSVQTRVISAGEFMRARLIAWDLLLMEKVGGSCMQGTEEEYMLQIQICSRICSIRPHGKLITLSGKGLQTTIIRGHCNAFESNLVANRRSIAISRKAFKGQNGASNHRQSSSSPP